MSTHPQSMDPRHFGTLLDPEDLEPLLAELTLPDHAPMPVLTALGVCRELIRFSYHRYEFAAVAVTHSLVALEQGLVTRLATPRPPAELVGLAVERGILPPGLAAELGACLDLRDRLGAGEAIGTTCGPAVAVRMVRAVVEAVTLLLPPAAEADGASLERLWEEHRSAPYPEGFRGVAVGEVELILVDADTAGYVLRELNGGLDPEGVAGLWACIAALDKALPLIHEAYCAAYFGKVRRAAMTAAARHLPSAGAARREHVPPDGSGSEALASAFPGELAAEAVGLIAVLPEARHRSDHTFTVLVGGEDLAIPDRIYRSELPSSEVVSLTERQRLMLHCLYTRHHDGRVRQRHLAPLLTATEPWVVPYTVQLTGEYVLEILTDLRDGYRELLVPGSRGSAVYGQFVVENPEFFARTERRLVSYWSAYHRRAYASFRGYPGGTALDLLRDAASERAGRPWPDRTPGRHRARLDGYC
ncbi:hypothetical protein ACIA8O_02835 [Kitasatospora sp. NPDC051853]|uniref:hypothetical protein n=1 Tax=Kitasatospora sp. NPDC051853 TaxID=3364058 RepID=UPI0037A08F24